MALCRFCNKWVTQPQGKKKKDFCNSTCRSNFWYAQNKKGKIDFVEPPTKVYDAPKMDVREIQDEPLNMEKLRQELVKNHVPLQMPMSVMDAAKLMRKLWDDKREIDNSEDYELWLQKVAGAPLTSKQKDLLKNTNQ